MQMTAAELKAWCDGRPVKGTATHRDGAVTELHFPDWDEAVERSRAFLGIEPPKKLNYGQNGFVRVDIRDTLSDAEETLYRPGFER